MLYQWFELSHAALRPARAAAGSFRMMLSNPLNPFGRTAAGRSTAAACEVFERTTRRYDKPVFGLGTTMVDGKAVAVTEQVVFERPFCNLLHFQRDIPATIANKQPRVLLVAPMSGHYATLLRGTVEAFLPGHEVYITDWKDARDVPLGLAHFDLDDYVDYVADMVRLFKGDVHVIAVCQPSVPVLAAISLMEAQNDPFVPASMCIMGGPIDTRISPTSVNKLAEDKGIEWFERNVINTVPWTHSGRGRKVYPGFLQLTGFMTMNLDRHITAHKDLFFHLIQGDGDSAEKHKEFYDEYLAVMDLTAEFYLQTVDKVFVQHQLPKGTLKHRGQAVDPSAIHRVALMTVEGEKDDLTGVGQSNAAHRLCSNIPVAKKFHYVQKDVGHFGVFNGSRFRSQILPRIATFLQHNDRPLPQRAAVRMEHAKPVLAQLPSSATPITSRMTHQKR